MKITVSEVEKVAKLANLPISSEEGEKYAEQLSAILDYIDQLNQVDTSEVEPVFNVTGQKGVMREDEVEDSLSQEEALSNTKNRKDGYFVTKGVFEEE